MVYLSFDYSTATVGRVDEHVMTDFSSHPAPFGRSPFSATYDCRQPPCTGGIGPGIAEARARLGLQKCKDSFKKVGDPLALLNSLNDAGLIQVNNTYPGGEKKRSSFETGNTGAVTSQGWWVLPNPRLSGWSRNTT